MSEQRFEFEVAEDQAGTRLDRFLVGLLPQLSRSAIQRLIDTGQISLNGESARSSYKVRPGDQIAVALDVPAERPAAPAAEPVPLTIAYEDAFLLLIDKPAGMVVHPAPGHPHGTLVNALLAYCPELGGDGSDRPGIVHRLDRDTSGLIVVAKNEGVRRALQRLFQDRQVEKVYLALLHGQLQPAQGRIEAPIGRDPYHRQKMAVLPGGREAVTSYRVVEYLLGQGGPEKGDYTLVEAQPHTGRTHQIRVHFAAIGHPVVGDRVYGHRRASPLVTRQFLHAHRLAFTHPISGRGIEAEAPLPADLVSALDRLRGSQRAGPKACPSGT